MSKFARGFIIFDIILGILVIGYLIFASAGTEAINVVRKGGKTVTEIAEKVRPDTARRVPEVTDPAVTEPAVTEFTVPSAYRISGVDVLYQEPELPTGCEITSLTILLNYLGFDVSKTTMAYDYMARDPQGVVGFEGAFIGDPGSYGGYGCFAPVIKEAANKYLAKNAEGYLAEDISGTDLDMLYWYVAHDIPAVTWCSMDLMSVDYRFAFTDASGKENYWYDNEHCVVLFGYDSENGTVTVSDPMYGIMTYSAARFQEIYDELGKQAVIIERLKF